VQEYKNFREPDREHIERPTTWWRVPITYEFVPFTQYAHLFRTLRGFLLFFMVVFYFQYCVQDHANTLVRSLTR